MYEIDVPKGRKKLDFSKVIRNFDVDHPRVTQYEIIWDDFE